MSAKNNNKTARWKSKIYNFNILTEFSSPIQKKTKEGDEKRGI